MNDKGRAYQLFFLLVLTFSAAQASRKSPNCDPERSGQVLVELFLWRWTDVATECENVLGPKGFCGVQVAPPNEHRVPSSLNETISARYQPVSYKLDSASGNRAEFKDMVTRCNAAGVRVYIDAVINNMVADDAGAGVGSAGSYYNAQNKTFPGVPYYEDDFGDQCSTGSGRIEDMDEVKDVRYCSLNGLLDLDTGSDDVKNKIAAYFNDMLAMGIDGYRIDSAKHMWQTDLDEIFQKTSKTTSGSIPFVYQELVSYDSQDAIPSSDYTGIGRVTEFKYGDKLRTIFLKNQISLDSLRTFGSQWGFLPSQDAISFVDNQDNQGRDSNYKKVITFRQSQEYTLASILMLSWPYGVPRVMSSYNFTQVEEGPPSVSPQPTGTCGNGWICEHRWKEISNMVEWRNHAGSNDVNNWWSNGKNQIAYSRGNSSFIVFNHKDGLLDKILYTGLPAGDYCDIISGDIENNICTGETITVGPHSNAQISIDGSADLPVIAFHLGSRLADLTTTVEMPTTTTTMAPPTTVTAPTTTAKTSVSTARLPTTTTMMAPATTVMVPTTMAKTSVTTARLPTTTTATAPTTTVTSPTTTATAVTMPTTTTTTVTIPTTTSTNVTTPATTTTTVTMPTTTATTVAMPATTVTLQPTTDSTTKPALTTVQSTTTTRVTTTTTLPPPPPPDKERTIVFIKKITGYGEKIFIRGGYDHGNPIPITYNYMNPQGEERKSWYHSYKTWSQGDTELNWDGAEDGQGQLNGEKALGSPMLWTDSNSASKEYSPENIYGDHYWMWDVSIDCSKLLGGYFEFKGFSSKNGYERDVRQERCLGETTSYQSNKRNHVAKCGHKTVVEWGNSNFCIMQRI